MISGDVRFESQNIWQCSQESSRGWIDSEDEPEVEEAYHSFEKEEDEEFVAMADEFIARFTTDFLG